jgi:hypothetical protein
MGCSESKSDEVTRPDDVKPKLSYDAPRPRPATGIFTSDVQDKSLTARTFSEVLVHKNLLPVHEVYNLDQGLELGRGACGTVSVVTKVATGACSVAASRWPPRRLRGGHQHHCTR